MTTPDLLVIGAQKAGTSWLHETLSQHPKIWVPPFKELHFFDHKFVIANRKWTHGHIEKGVKEAIARHLKLGVLDPAYVLYLEAILQRPIFNRNWYRLIFSRCPQDHIGMDVTPEYCSVPPEGILFMAAFLPKAKYVYVIRDPVTRAISQIKMNAFRRKRALVSIEDWMSLAEEPVVHERGDYARYVSLWDTHIAAEKLLYVPFLKIKTNPLAVLRSVEKLVGLKSATYRRIDHPIHAGPIQDAPMAVKDHLKRSLQDQTNFLINRFGTEFACQI